MVDAIDQLSGNLTPFPPQTKVTANTVSAAARATAATATPTRVATSAATNAGQPRVNQIDTAELSQTAQAKLLQEQGLSVVEIAYQLGITQDTVIGDLAVAATSQAANTQAKAAAT